MVARHVHRVRARFCIPGHGGGRLAPPAARRFLGLAAFRADVTQTPDIDDALDPGGTFGAARTMAAQTWKADQAWFLTGGSSAGVQAMFLAALSPGQTVVMPRDIHLSALWGLVMSGAVPRFLPLRWDASGWIPQPVQAADVSGHEPLFVVRPSYYGLCCNLRELTGPRTVLVDEAWGGHLGFGSGPESSMQQGADAAVTSAHKMLTALSGTAMVLARGERVAPDRLQQAVVAVSTTSPYYGQWVSLEATVEQMRHRGSELVARAYRTAAQVRSALSALPHVTLSDTAEDATRILFGVHGWRGYDLEQALLRRGIAVEMATLSGVLLVVGFSTRDSDVERLLRCLARLTPRKHVAVPLPWVTGPLQMPPREAFFAPRRRVPLAQAEGRVAAEPMAVYPPGVPAIIPGEKITREVIDSLTGARQAGARLLGSTDTSAESLLTVA